MNVAFDPILYSLFAENEFVTNEVYDPVTLGCIETKVPEEVSKVDPKGALNAKVSAEEEKLVPSIEKGFIVKSKNAVFGISSV